MASRTSSGSSSRVKTSPVSDSVLATVFTAIVLSEQPEVPASMATSTHAARAGVDDGRDIQESRISHRVKESGTGNRDSGLGQAEESVARDEGLNPQALPSSEYRFLTPESRNTLFGSDLSVLPVSVQSAS